MSTRRRHEVDGDTCEDVIGSGGDNEAEVADWADFYTWTVFDVIPVSLLIELFPMLLELFFSYVYKANTLWEDVKTFQVVFPTERGRSSREHVLGSTWIHLKRDRKLVGVY